MSYLKKKKICWRTKVDRNIQGKRNKLQLQQLKVLRVLNKFKVHGKDMEDPMNFSEMLMLSVIRMGQGSERFMNMIEIIQTLGPPSFLITEGNMMKFLSGRVPIYLHPSLYRALKLIFPWDIEVSLMINKEIGFQFMS